jgi:hypothetical protein
MAIVVPEKIYIGYQERTWGEDKPIKLGFATYLEDNKAFENRKVTIEGWSQPYSEEQIKEGDDDWDPERAHWNYQRRQVPQPDLASEILDNDARSGFKLSREVRRGGSWGGGNVLWRIEDPRGFELEISSANMAAILDCVTMIKGEIQTPCRWGWNKTGGSRVVLLPEDSEPYKEALKDTEIHNNTVKWKDINIGDELKLKNGTVGTYLGSHHYVSTKWVEWGERMHRNQTTKEWKKSSRRTHFFKLADTDEIYIMGSPKVAIISKPIETPMTPEEGAKVVNQALQNYAKIQSASYCYDIIFVSSNVIKESEYRITFEPLPYELFEEYVTNPVDYDAPTIKKHENTIVTFGDGRTFVSQYIRSDDNVQIEQIDKTKLLAGRLESIMINEERTGNFGWCSNYKTTNTSYVPIEIIKPAEINTIMMKFEDELYPVRL